jgi:hypothetical protein
MVDTTTQSDPTNIDIFDFPWSLLTEDPAICEIICAKVTKPRLTNVAFKNREKQARIINSRLFFYNESRKHKLNA